MGEHYSAYDNEDHITKTVADGRHRDVIGGMWDKLGALQHDYLVAQGLLPHHNFIDVGCGSLRAGVPLTRYLDPNRYYGVDLSEELLVAGYEREIIPAGLADKLPRHHLFATAEFELSQFGMKFDYGIAQSVFTHMPIRRLTDCLNRIAPDFAPGGRFYVTFFERPEIASDDEPVAHEPGGITTYPDRDPYDNRRATLAHANTSDWDLDIIGDWNHPRDQQMALFVRRDG